MKTKQIILLASSCLFSFSTAFATDYYAGLQTGVAYNTFDKDVKTDSTGLLAKQASYKPLLIGGVAGLYAGIAQKIDSFSIGLEANANGYTGKSKNELTIGTKTYSTQDQLLYSAGLSILPGIYIASNNMLYVRGGAVMGHFKGDSDGDAYITGNTGSFSKNDLGFVTGIGLSSRFTKHMSLRAEYDYSQYKTFSKTSHSDQAGANVLTKYKPKSSTFLVGVAYHF